MTSRVKIKRLLGINMDARFEERALTRLRILSHNIAIDSYKRQQTIPEAITRYSAGPAQRRRQIDPSLVLAWDSSRQTQIF